MSYRIDIIKCKTLNEITVQDSITNHNKLCKVEIINDSLISQEAGSSDDSECSIDVQQSIPANCASNQIHRRCDAH